MRTDHDTLVATAVALAERARRGGAARLILVLGQNAPAPHDPDGPAFPPGTHSRRRAVALWRIPPATFETFVRVNVLPREPERVEHPLAVGGARLAAVLDVLGASDLDVIAAGALAAEVATARLGLRRRPEWNTIAPTRRGRLLCVGHPSGLCRQYNDEDVRGATAAAIRALIAPVL